MNFSSEILAHLILDVGEQMLISGVEINRVEDTMHRIAVAYEVEKIDVFSITSLIVISFTKENHTTTQMRRVYSYGTNLEILENINALSRNICEKKLSLEQAHEALKNLVSQKNSIKLEKFVGYIMASASSSLFWGGNLLDAISAALISIIIFLLDSYVKNLIINKMVYTILTSFIAGFIAILSVKLGLGIHEDKIMIGDIMLLIPGLMTVNSIRDMLCGDIMSGLLRLAEAVLISVSIACGFAVSSIFFGGML